MIWHTDKHHIIFYIAYSFFRKIALRYSFLKLLIEWKNYISDLENSFFSALIDNSSVVQIKSAT